MKNLMRSLTAWLEDDYCSITVVNHQLITVIRFVVKSYSHPWKGFANKFRLVLYVYNIFFSKIMCDRYDRKTKQGLRKPGTGNRDKGSRTRRAHQLRRTAHHKELRRTVPRVGRSSRAVARRRRGHGGTHGAREERSTKALFGSKLFSEVSVTSKGILLFYSIK